MLGILLFEERKQWRGATDPFFMEVERSILPKVTVSEIEAIRVCSSYSLFFPLFVHPVGTQAFCASHKIPEVSNSGEEKEFWLIMSKVSPWSTEPLNWGL